MFRVRATPSAPRVDQNYGRFAGISLPRFQRNLLQRRNHRSLPVVAAPIWVFRVSSVARTNEPARFTTPQAYIRNTWTHGARRGSERLRSCHWRNGSARRANRDGCWSMRA